MSPGRAEKRRAAWAALRGTPAAGRVGRPYLGVRFECCGVYVRIYRNHEHTAYEGRCPRCLRAVRFRVAPGGATDRFYRAL
jgi:hypothetical protein